MDAEISAAQIPDDYAADDSSLWDDLYSKGAISYWGQLPDPLLEAHHHLVPPGDILDIGAGEGRNSRRFAVEGRIVVAIDYSAVACKRMREAADELNLSHVDIRREDITTIEIDPKRYALVIASGILSNLEKAKASDLVPRLCSGVAPGGLIYFGVMSLPSPETLKTLDPEILAASGLGNFACFDKSELQDLIPSHFKTLDSGIDLVVVRGRGAPHYRCMTYLIACNQTP